jgi:two-component system cell cycle sensor histidine kinase/response regulator CckA
MNASIRGRRTVPANRAIQDADSGDAEAGAGAPRPPGVEDIAAMLASAEARARQVQPPADRASRKLLRLSRPAAMDAFFAGLGAAGLSGAAFLATSGPAIAGPFLAAGVGALALGLCLAAFRSHSAATGLGGALRPSDPQAQLGGLAMLRGAGLAEGVLDSDPDPRLITRGNGVVVYANAAYFALAGAAGVAGPGGLPPRIDRLFSQQGAEATKLFRLCRAAKSGVAGAETICQRMGLEGGGARRRFEIATYPIAGARDFASWRLRELPVDEEAHDFLAAAYADHPRPVFALERSGQIAWANAATRDALGFSRSELQHIEDILLGESAETIRTLWRADRTPIAREVRRREGDSLEATFIAFRRGGVGEGFVCVDLEIRETAAEGDGLSSFGDMGEAPFGLAVVEGEIGRDARIVESNRAFAEQFGGVKRNTPLARILPPAVLDEIAAEIRRKATSAGGPNPIDATIGEAGDQRTYGVYARPLKRRRGAYGSRRTFLYTVDVTDRKQMEQDHAQDQKLKAIGFIAGGVAHDFNNLLQVIQGNCEQLMLRHPVGDPAYQDLVLIRENAQRAANLTKQLLAYSRKQTLTRKVQSITDLLLDFSRFLDRAVGEKVKIELLNGRGLPPIRVDRSQLETALMNLAVNARDAMAPQGGKLVIRTSLVSAAEAGGLNLAGLSAQDYVLIEVADTGPGVSPEIMPRIFDPFFTTKEEGKGTGLGLSTVHGIIGQMGGAITVENAEGGGALFKVYLPAHHGATDEQDAPAPVAARDYSGTGRILVVEDEDPVRAFVVATLERSGYEVTAAEDGAAALEILRSDRNFDLIVTDVMMPETDGPTLVLRARQEFGVAAPVIFMSGYAESAMREQMDRIEGGRYIQKPFPMAELGARVKDALSERQIKT